MTLVLTAVAIAAVSAIATRIVAALTWRSYMRQVADILGPQSEAP